MKAKRQTDEPTTLRVFCLHGTPAHLGRVRRSLREVACRLRGCYRFGLQSAPLAKLDFAAVFERTAAEAAQADLLLLALDADGPVPAVLRRWLSELPPPSRTPPRLLAVRLTNLSASWKVWKAWEAMLVAGRAGRDLFLQAESTAESETVPTRPQRMPDERAKRR